MTPTPILLDAKFYLALQSALTALVITVVAIYYPDQLVNISKIVAAVNGVIAVFIGGLVIPPAITKIITPPTAPPANKK